MGHGLDPVDQELRMAFTFFKGLKKTSDRLCDHKGYSVSCHVLKIGIRNQEMSKRSRVTVQSRAIPLAGNQQTGG